MEAPPPAPSPRSPEAAAAASAASSVSPPAAAEPPDDAIAHASPPHSSPPPSLAAAPPPQPPCAPPPAPPEAPLTTSTLVVAAAAPPETHFASREQLLAHVHAFSLRQGYAVVIQKSNVPRGQLWLRCDLGGSYRSASSSASSSTNSSASSSSAAESRKRKSSSRLQNCPFQLYARRLPDARWLLKVQNAAHNHAVDPEQLEAHPAARRLSLAQKQLVDELTSVGARPAHIVERLKEQFPDKPVKVQDIYNARNYIRRERGAGRVPFAQSHAGSGQEDEDEEDPKQPADAAAPVDALAAALSSSSASSASPLSTVRASTGGVASGSHTNASNAEHLQTLLDGASEQFSGWQPRTQKQFLFQLEALLARCSKSEPARGSSSSSVAKRVDHEPSTESPSSSSSRSEGGDAPSSSSAAVATPLLL